MRKLVYVLLIFTLSCAPKRSISTTTAIPPPPIPTPAVITEPIPPPIDPQFVHALDEYKRTKKPVTVMVEDVPHFLYRDRFLVRIEPQEFLDIQFSPGEVIRKVLVGNKDGWSGDKERTGDGAAERWHAILSPEWENKTDVRIYTNKRLYILKAQTGSGGQPRIGFWFPQEIEQAMAERERLIAKAQATPAPKAPVRNERYVIAGNEPWTPLQAFDDDERVYLLLPETVRTAKLPALYITENGTQELVNYSVQFPWVIVPQLFQEASLIEDVGRRQKVATIRRAN